MHLRKLVITVCCCFINSLFPDSWDKMCVSDDVLTHGKVLCSFWIILFTFKNLRIVVVFAKQNTLKGQVAGDRPLELTYFGKV